MLLYWYTRRSEMMPARCTSSLPVASAHAAGALPGIVC